MTAKEKKRERANPAASILAETRNDGVVHCMYIRKDDPDMMSPTWGAQIMLPRIACGRLVPATVKVGVAVQDWLPGRLDEVVAWLGGLSDLAKQANKDYPLGWELALKNRKDGDTTGTPGL